MLNVGLNMDNRLLKPEIVSTIQSVWEIEDDNVYSWHEYSSWAEIRAFVLNTLYIKMLKHYGATHANVNKLPLSYRIRNCVNMDLLCRLHTSIYACICLSAILYLFYSFIYVKFNGNLTYRSTCRELEYYIKSFCFQI